MTLFYNAVFLGCLCLINPSVQIITCASHPFSAGVGYNDPKFLWSFIAYTRLSEIPTQTDELPICKMILVKLKIIRYPPPSDFTARIALGTFSSHPIHA